METDPATKTQSALGTCQCMVSKTHPVSEMRLRKERVACLAAHDAVPTEATTPRARRAECPTS